MRVGNVLAILICSRYFCFCAARLPLASNSSVVGGGGGTPKPFGDDEITDDVMSLLSLIEPYCRVLMMNDGFRWTRQNGKHNDVVVGVDLDVVRPVTIVVVNFTGDNPRRPITVTYASVMMRPRTRNGMMCIILWLCLCVFLFLRGLLGGLSCSTHRGCCSIVDI